jgi:hypothetical protein
VAWEKKPDAPNVIDLGTELLGQIVGTDAAWLGSYIPFLGQTTVDVTTFCRAGPPPDAQWNAGDLLSFTNPISGVMGFQKMQRVALAEVFPKFCESTEAVQTCKIVGLYEGNNFGNNQLFVAAIPAGALSVKLTLDAGTNTRLVIYNVPPTPPGSTLNGGIGTEFAEGVPQEFAWPAGSTTADVRLHDADGSTRSVTMEVCMPASTDVPYIPSPEPPNIIPPPQTTGSTDIPGLAKDLAALETKLDIIRAIVSNLAGAHQLPAVDDGEPPTDPASTTSASLEGAKGFVISVSGLPDYLGGEPGSPPRHFRMGRYVVGYPQGWGPSQELEFEQTVVMPLPLGATSVNVHVWPPMVASITKLVEATKPPTTAP